MSGREGRPHTFKDDSVLYGNSLSTVIIVNCLGFTILVTQARHNPFRYTALMKGVKWNALPWVNEDGGLPRNSLVNDNTHND